MLLWRAPRLFMEGMCCVVCLGFIACGIRFHTCPLRNWFSVGTILWEIHSPFPKLLIWLCVSLHPAPPTHPRRVLQVLVNWLGPASAPLARTSQALPILPSDPHRLRGPASQIPQHLPCLIRIWHPKPSWVRVVFTPLWSTHSKASFLKHPKPKVTGDFVGELIVPGGLPLCSQEPAAVTWEPSGLPATTHLLSVPHLMCKLAGFCPSKCLDFPLLSLLLKPENLTFLSPL